MAYVNLGQVMYPVGAIYQSWSSTSPANLFGGQWTQITEKFLFCANSAGGTGGASTVTLSEAQIPNHKHRQNFGNHNAVVGAYADWYSDNVQVSGQYAASASTVTTFAQTTQRTGGGASHENMPPYIRCYTWRRTS